MNDGAAAVELGQRYLERFANAPLEASFLLDAKDSNIKLADFVQVTSKQYQDFSGSPLDILLQVVKRIEKQTGTTWAFTARQFAYSSDLNPVRPIKIDGSNALELFDLDLKAAHDARFAPATTGTVIEIIIKSGVLVSASSTANYALTNPNTWASGVIIRLIIESGAVVAGRGGDGGDGGDGASLFTGYSTPSSAGTKGGNAILVESALSITNLGIIGAGGGGGGGGGFTIVKIHSSPDIYEANTSGGGGGGGAGIGSGGVTGQFLGTSAPNGSAGGNAIGGTGADGGAGIGVGGVTGHDSRGGKGGDLNEDGGQGYPLSTIPTVSVAGSAGGAHGDYAVNGNSFITWTATGTIYGAII